MRARIRPSHKERMMDGALAVLELWSGGSCFVGAEG